MTDINRLIASLKRRSSHVKEFGDDVTFVKLEDLDALVEALEKAQQTEKTLKSRNCRLEGIITAAENRISELGKTIAEQDKRLINYAEISTRNAERAAELESRTVTVKQYDEFQICHYGATEDYAKGYIDCQNNFFKWLNTAGIKWEAE
ncbi:hypothetical protein ACHBJW_005059 [Klebsiella aerogenes]